MNIHIEAIDKILILSSYVNFLNTKSILEYVTDDIKRYKKNIDNNTILFMKAYFNQIQLGIRYELLFSDLFKKYNLGILKHLNLKPLNYENKTFYKQFLEIYNLFLKYENKENIVRSSLFRMECHDEIRTIEKSNNFIPMC